MSAPGLLTIQARQQTAFVAYAPIAFSAAPGDWHTPMIGGPAEGGRAHHFTQVVTRAEAHGSGNRYVQVGARQYMFAHLRASWLEDTAYESNPERITAHPCYLRIIGMGQAALPLILQSLTDEGDSPSFWFPALTAITGVDPIPVDHYGNYVAMANDWLNWARSNYIF